MTWFKKDQHKLIQEILDLSDVYVLETDVTKPGDWVKAESDDFSHPYKGRKTRINKIVYGFNSHPDLRLIYIPRGGKHRYEFERGDDR